MGELGGFLKIERTDFALPDPQRARRATTRSSCVTRPSAELREQGARCMDCGVPFCHNGCPLGNLIPDWNDLVYRDRWRDAIDQLHATNNFPEFTGRLCPAPCEAACVLEINEGDAVTIKQIENAIINRAWEEGWVVPAAPARRDRPQASRSSARARRAWPPPSSCAAPATRVDGVRARRGRRRARALRRPRLQDREVGRRAPRRRSSRPRASSSAAASTSAATSPASELRARASTRSSLAIGSRVPRDLPVPGRELDGVHFAMDYLYQRNRWVAGESGPSRGAAPAPSARSPPRAST